MNAGQSDKAIDKQIDKQTYVYKRVRNTEIAADVYTTGGTVDRPAILWIHGGALIMGTRSQIPAYQLQRYVQAGYAVVSIDYRLAPETKLDGIIADLGHAYAWVLRDGPGLFGLDGERIAVIGHSAGGYLALMAGCCVMPRPRALVAFYGYGDITGAWYSRPDPFYCQQPLVAADEAYAAVGDSQPICAQDGHESQPICSQDGHEKSMPTAGIDPARGRFYLYCRQTGRWPLEVAGHDPEAEAEWFARFCPLRNVSPVYPPTLLIHGDQDTDVPYGQSALMAAELARHGVAHRFLTMTGDGHGFDRAAGAAQDPKMVHLFDTIVDFLAGTV